MCVYILIYVEKYFQGSRSLVPEKKNRPQKFGERKRGPKPKIKTGQLGITGQMSYTGETKTVKSRDDDDDENDDHPTTLILANSKDEFVLEQVIISFQFNLLCISGSFLLMDNVVIVPKN